MHKVIVTALALLASACTAAPPQPFAGADPSDPDARVAATAYRSAIGRYQSQRPVPPATWREQNERVAPTPKQ
jgi:hypothetical protein